MLSPIDQCLQPFYPQRQTTLFSVVQKCSIQSALDGSVPSESLPSHCSTTITTLRKQGPACVGIASSTLFNQNLDFRLLWHSEIENHILLPCLLSAVASWKAFLTTSRLQLLLAVKPSELALNLKIGCVLAAQSTYIAWPSSAATSVQALICCIDLWVSLEQKVLPSCMNMNLKIKKKKLAFQYVTKDIFTLRCWGAQNQPHLRQNCIKPEVGRHGE